MSTTAFASDTVLVRARKAMETLNASPARLGSFPTATLDACIAAEILMGHLQSANAGHGGAVEVVQVRGGGKTVFVVACSGAPAGLDPALGPGELERLGTLTSARLGMPCSFIYANSAYDFYLPMNADFLKLFEGITKTFNPPTQWLKFDDVTKKLNAVQELVEKKQMSKLQQPLDKKYRQTNKLELRPTAGAGDRTSAIKDIATVALALHMNACGGDGDMVSVFFELTLNLLELHAIVIADHWGKEAGWINSFVACARALAKKTQDTPADLTPFVVDLEPETSKAFLKYVELKKGSLFCAEPRAFASISKQLCSVHGTPATGIVSQACIWCPGGGRACPDEYIVDGTKHGNWCYMWPCKSCKARSSFMMAGLNVIPQSQRRSFEAP